MKLLIVGSPKTGNVWIERLLATIYGLPIVDMSGSSYKAIPSSRLDRPRFVAHQHYACTQELLDWGRLEGVTFITPLRHPGDVFVSLFHYINEFAARNEAHGIAMSPVDNAIVGKRIDSAEVLDYLSRHFLPRVMRLSLEWMKSGGSIPVRYEELRESGADALARLSRRLKAVAPETIALALEANRIERVREIDPFLNLHCRDGSSMQWRRELSEEHLRIFREQWRDELDALGYSFD